MPISRSTSRLRIWTPKLCLLAALLAIALSAGDARADASDTTVDQPTAKSGLGPESGDSTEAIENKANKLYWQEKYSEAARLFRSLLPSKIDQNAIKDPVVVHRLKDLADSLSHESNYKEAANLYARLET